MKRENNLSAAADQRQLSTDAKVMIYQEMTAQDAVQYLPKRPNLSFVIDLSPSSHPNRRETFDAF